MKKKLLNMEKSVVGKKNPTSLGGYGKMLGYGVSGLAWMTSHIQLWGLQFDASVAPATSVKDQYKRTFSNGEAEAIEKTDKLRKELHKLDRKISKTKKAKRLLELDEERELLVDEISRHLKLVSELRRKLGK